MDYDYLVCQIQQVGGLEGFIVKWMMFEKMKDEIFGLLEEEKCVLVVFYDIVREWQKQKFLEGFFIDVVFIFGVGFVCKVVLWFFGIEIVVDVICCGVK